MIILRKRLLIIASCALPITVLLVLLFKNMAYVKDENSEDLLKMKYDFELVEKNGTSKKRVVNANAKFIIKSTSASNSTHVNETSSTLQYLNDTTITANVTDTKKILMDSLHKYSLYNPGFRHFTEWPPIFWNLNENPNLAEVWEANITEDMPNWKKFLYKISKYYLYEDSPLVEDLLHDIATKKIIAVDVHPGGTQFKLIMLFEDGGRALFKPMRFPRNIERDENVLYLADYERHVSEIAAFHLDRLLGFRRVPPVVGRKINITGELLPLVLDDIDLVDTFYFSPDGNYCFAGLCKMYCSELFGGFCGNPYMLEGSFAVYIPPLPVELLEHREVENPWRRTYELNNKAEWEIDPDYCTKVIEDIQPFNESRRLFDAIDCAIFDYLIGNENRVNFDEFTVFGDDNTPTVILFDNGQGFGRSDRDEMIILAPLTQCCLVRLSTFNKLYELYIGIRPLSELMRASLAKDPLAPILTEAHLRALDRRLEKVLSVIRFCILTNSAASVFHDDIMS